MLWKQAAVVVMAVMLAFSVAGCTQRERTGTLIGAGVGAVAGGLASESVGGAVVGGAIGAGTGYLIARHTD
jgi:hypothetical protein